MWSPWFILKYLSVVRVLKLAHPDLPCDKSVRDDLNGLHFKIRWNRAPINTLSVMSLFISFEAGIDYAITSFE